MTNGNGDTNHYQFAQPGKFTYFMLCVETSRLRPRIQRQAVADVEDPIHQRLSLTNPLALPLMYLYLIPLTLSLINLIPYPISGKRWRLTDEVFDIISTRHVAAGTLVISLQLITITADSITGI